MISSLCMLACVAAVDVSTQHLMVEISPDTHGVAVVSRITAAGAGELEMQLTNMAAIDEVTVGGEPADYEMSYSEAEGEPGTLLLLLEGDVTRQIVITYEAQFQQDISVGEKPGQIHNFSVDAHVSEDGVFLSDGSAWHPRPMGSDGYPALHEISLDIKPVDGWAFVASGDPVDKGDITAPRWRWAMPRPVDGMAIAGNRHSLFGRVHETKFGPVEVVMHVPDSHAELAPMFVDAACEYLDLYPPLLGPFPYKRFSIVENFFSSGFAYPGFTVLGPRVVGMVPRSLMPGFLDHELVHNWWGNGVYVDPDGGNWCEALTTYCANYYRRVVDGGEEAGREYRRSTLMKLSADPDTLDNGPLSKFGSADPKDGDVHRFVGYDKGAFVFIMLERAKPIKDDEINRQRIWQALRQFASDNLGKRAGWPEIKSCFRAAIGDTMMKHFAMWVDRNTKPLTPTTNDPSALMGMAMQYMPALAFTKKEGTDDVGRWYEIDPDFYWYRILPPSQIVPLIGGATGPGGLKMVADQDRPETAVCEQLFELDDDGENLLIVGSLSARSNAPLLAKTSDPIDVRIGSFTVGGVTYDKPTQAVLHTMAYPDKPGRFITVFASNGDAGWAKLRLIKFYGRDTTVVWEDGEVIQRRTYEPSRIIYK